MSDAHAAARRIPGVGRARQPVSAAGAGGPRPALLVAVLCTAPRARAIAAGVALALARATSRPCALAGTLGGEPGAALGGMPAARRAAAALRRRELPAGASGRLVWLADRRGPLDVDHADLSDDVGSLDPASRAAALSAELGRSAAALGLPAAIALPLARTDALDRVLAWHDAVVVVREPDAPAVAIERALASLAALGRPVAAMAPPARLPGALAIAGLAIPAEATAAVAQLAAGAGQPGPHDA